MYCYKTYLIHNIFLCTKKKNEPTQCYHAVIIFFSKCTKDLGKRRYPNNHLYNFHFNHIIQIFIIYIHLMVALSLLQFPLPRPLPRPRPRPLPLPRPARPPLPSPPPRLRDFPRLVLDPNEAA